MLRGAAVRSRPAGISVKSVLRVSGSLSSSKAGSTTSARARATRCCCPPDSADGKRRSDPLRRAPARQCRKIKTDRLGSELRPAQIDPSREAALAIKTAESTLQPGDRLVPKRRIILAMVDKHFPERKSPMPEKAELAFLFGQVAPDLVAGNGGADMVRASSLACSGNFSLRLC
jgi:hypothetical protein